MRFTFGKRKLRQLYEEERGADNYPPEIVEAFFEVVASITGASDERDLRALQGLHYHKLKGKRSGQHALNLNDQWRLVIERKKDRDGRYLSIVDIVDYH